MQVCKCGSVEVWKYGSVEVWKEREGVWKIGVSSLFHSENAQ